MILELLLGPLRGAGVSVGVCTILSSDRPLLGI